MTYLRHQMDHLPISLVSQTWMVALFGLAIALSLATFWFPMRRGIRALEELG